MQNLLSSSWNQNPDGILETLKSDEQSVSQSLNGAVSGKSGIKDTLEGISNGIGPYIDWLFFTAWTGALILLMYNGLKLMVSSGLGQNETSKIKSRLINLSIGVVVISGVYIILRTVVWFINYLTR